MNMGNAVMVMVIVIGIRLSSGQPPDGGEIAEVLIDGTNAAAKVKDIPGAEKLRTATARVSPMRCNFSASQADHARSLLVG